MRMLPCPYHRYYYMSDDMYRRELSEAKGEGTRGEVVKATRKELFDIYRNPELAENPKLLRAAAGNFTPMPPAN